MIKIENRQVFSTEGKAVRRLGTDVYFKRGTTLPTDTVEDFEEVDEEPAYTKAEYDAKVAELVRERYTESEEFAIQRKAINAAFSPSPTDSDSKALEEYRAYNAYVEECKQRGKDPALYRSIDESPATGGTPRPTNCPATGGTPDLPANNKK